MEDFPKFSTSFVRGLAGILIGGFALYYGVVHLGLTMPLREVVAPWVAHSVLGVLAIPFLYWSLKHERSSGGDLRPFFVTAGTVCALGCLVIFYYAHKLGFIPPRHLRGLSLTVVLVVPPATWVAYYMNQKIFPRRYYSQPSDDAKKGRGGLTGNEPSS